MYSVSISFFLSIQIFEFTEKKKECYISLHQQSIIKLLKKRNSKQLPVTNRRRHIFHGTWTRLSHGLLKPTFDYHRRVDHPPSSPPPPPQDDRFSPRIVSRLKAVGFIRAKGNVAYNGEKAFSWGGKGVVSCQVYDVFLISFIDATGIRVSGWYILTFGDVVVVKL